ncbi:MAG: site-2 protease family protein [Clostridia bacterium]|nr:site-2 protease family protein [Clostridia bacterium]
MTFSVGRTEIRVTVGAILLPLFALVAGEVKLLLAAVLSFAIHEAAHLIAAKNLGLSAARVTLYPFGAVMRLDALLSDTRGEWIVAAAGPLGSLTFAAFLKLLPSSAWIGRMTETNLAIALLNLLPAFPLDGGRIFRALLSRVVRARTARTLLFVFTALIALGMLGLGGYLVFRGVPAWTLFAIPPFLIASVIAEWRMPDAGIVSRVMDRSASLRAGNAQKAQIVVISDHASVGTALNTLSGSRFTILRVQRGTGFVELNETALLDAAALSGTQVPLKTVISRLTDGK